METLKVTIRKPLYGNFCYIRESIINSAIYRGVQMEITVPNGKAIVDPQKWKDTGKRMSKVFLRPDEPMILWGNNVPVPLPPALKKVEDKKESSQLKLL